MLTLATTVVIVVAAAVVPASAVTDGRVVLDISQGRLSGVKEHSVKGRPFYAFRSIPFAKPPVGSLRFKDPEPAEGWEGTRDASTYPPRCIQQPLIDCFEDDYFIAGQEDCLFLNVYTPKVSRGSRLPVLFYLHGGGFQSGESYSYPPDVFLDRDVVLVVPQYRIGPFGFLSTEDSVLPGNYGLKDQILALRWVQKNIGSFGGDPSRVSLIGQSAGGASAQYLMLIPEAEGLFSSAIIQSGSALLGWAREDDNQREATLRLAKAVGCPTDQGSPKLLKCLQKVSATTLTSHYTNMTNFLCFPFHSLPRVDGHFIRDHPARIISSGKFTKVPIMIGTTQHDLGFFPQIILSRDHLREKVVSNISALVSGMAYKAPTLQEAEEQVRRVFDHFLGGIHFDERNADVLSEIYSDSAMNTGTDVSARLHSQHHPVFVYEFRHKGKDSHSSQIGGAFAEKWVVHFDALLYQFQGGEFGTLSDPKDLEVRDMLVTLLTNFAATGNPTPDDSLGFKWEATSPSSVSQLIIQSQPFMERNAWKKRLNFWLDLPAFKTLKDALEGKFKDEL